jgi:hypothetical protein
MCASLALTLRSLAPFVGSTRVYWPPNNSLKLTRRAALSGHLALPANQAENPSRVARFRRAA